MRYAEKSAFSRAESVLFSERSAIIARIAGDGLQQLGSSHVFQDFAPKNGRAKSLIPVLGRGAGGTGLGRTETARSWKSSRAFAILRPCSPKRLPQRPRGASNGSRRANG